MQIVTVTDEARKVQAAIKRQSDKIDVPLIEKVLLPVALGAAGAAVVDAVARSSGVQVLTFLIVTLLAYCFVVVWSLYERVGNAHLRETQARLRANGNIIDVPDSVVELWAARRSIAGLRSDEKRAEISMFPDTVKRIVELQAAHDNDLTPLDEKRELLTKIEQLMDEELVPLMHELRTFHAEQINSLLLEP